MNSRKKGQVEFIVIIALVVVAIVAVVLASRQAAIQPSITPGLTEEAKTIKDSVVNLIRAGAKDKLLLIYNQGGVLKPGSPTVTFGMFDTQVWSACGESNVPDVSKEIGAGVWAYLRENLEDEMEFYGKKVTFDFSKPKYEVDIFKDRLNVRIYLPTKVEDLDIAQPYEISLNSKLYDVLDFSNNFVSDNAKNRFFEMVTVTSMVHSNPDSEAWVPVAGVQAGCGNILSKTRSQLLPGIKGIIRYTVSHVVWNTQPLKLAENPFYPISSVGGKFYPDMQVAFAYPDSWDSEIDKYFMFSPDPLRVIPKPIMPLIPICMGPYSVAYSFRYPVVVMVEDTTLGQWFKFAVMVDVQNTQPGNCTAEFGQESEYTKTCVTDAKCSAKVTVKDTAGKPIEGADVSFYICDVGKTDKNGVVEAKIPCIVSELHVYSTGYRTFGDLFRSDEVADKTVTMEKIEDTITIHFKALEAEASGTGSNGVYGSYSIKSASKDLTAFGDRKLTLFLTFSPEDPNYFTGEDSAIVLTNYDESGGLLTATQTPGIQPVEYRITASLSDTTDEENSMPVGYIDTQFEIKEGKKDIYVYLPAVLKADGSDLPAPGIDPAEAAKLTSLVKAKCGGQAVSDSELSC